MFHQSKFINNKIVDSLIVSKILLQNFALIMKCKLHHKTQHFNDKTCNLCSFGLTCIFIFDYEDRLAYLFDFCNTL